MKFVIMRYRVGTYPMPRGFLDYEKARKFLEKEGFSKRSDLDEEKKEIWDRDGDQAWIEPS